MAVSPITLQMTIPMTNDVAQVQNNENMRANIEHMQMAQNNEKKTQEARETVVQKNNAAFDGVTYDAREKGSNTYFGDGGQKRKRKQEEKEDTSSDNAEKKHVVSIDIKL